MKSLKKVLVTGAAGFIGSNLVNKLLDLNYYVIGVDNLSSGSMDNISMYMNNENFKFIIGDVTDYNLCCELTKEVDYILHQAAINSVPRSLESPELYFSNNLVGFNNLLDAARKNNIKKFVYASSSSVYGDNQDSPKREDKIGKALSPYSLTKQNNETWAKLYSDIFGLPTIGLRYFNVFGPKQKINSEYSAVIPKFIYSILKKETLTIYGDGMQKRDFTYVDNVVDANIKAMNDSNYLSGEVYNIAGGKAVSVNDVLYAIEGELNSKTKINYAELRKGDVLNSCADISKAKKDLNYIPIVDFDSGIKKTVQWYVENGGIL